MRKFFYLKTCNTCQRIMKELGDLSSYEQREIKSEPVTREELEEMAKLAGSYESLFSRRSRQYRAKGLHDRVLTEEDYKALILEEYTFLKRPVLISGEHIFIGNSKKVVEEMKNFVSKK